MVTIFEGFEDMDPMWKKRADNFSTNDLKAAIDEFNLTLPDTNEQVSKSGGRVVLIDRVAWILFHRDQIKNPQEAGTNNDENDGLNPPENPTIVTPIPGRTRDPVVGVENEQRNRVLAPLPQHVAPRNLAKESLNWADLPTIVTGPPSGDITLFRALHDTAYFRDSLADYDSDKPMVNLLVESIRSKQHLEVGDWLWISPARLSSHGGSKAPYYDIQVVLQNHGAIYEVTATKGADSTLSCCLRFEMAMAPSGEFDESYVLPSEWELPDSNQSWVVPPEGSICIDAVFIAAIGCSTRKSNTKTIIEALDAAGSRDSNPTSRQYETPKLVERCVIDYHNGSQKLVVAILKPDLQFETMEDSRMFRRMGDAEAHEALMKDQMTLQTGRYMLSTIISGSQSGHSESANHVLASGKSKLRWLTGEVAILQETSIMEPSLLFRLVSVGFEPDPDRLASNRSDRLGLVHFLERGSTWNLTLNHSMKLQLVTALMNLERAWSIVMSPIWAGCCLDIRNNLMRGPCVQDYWGAPMLLWLLEKLLASFCSAARYSANSVTATATTTRQSFQVLVNSEFSRLLTVEEGRNVIHEYYRFTVLKTKSATSSKPTDSPKPSRTRTPKKTGETKPTLNTSPEEPTQTKRAKKGKGPNSPPEPTATKTREPIPQGEFPCPAHILHSLKIIDPKTKVRHICAHNIAPSKCRWLHENLNADQISKQDLLAHIQLSDGNAWRYLGKGAYASAIHAANNRA